MQCDMCGKEASLKNVKIEGVIMNVCPNCSKYGETIQKPNFQSQKYSKFNSKPKKDNFEQKESLIQNYGFIIKNKRENMGIKQEDLAKMLSEKESIIHRIESSSPNININLAKKIQRILNIKIIKDSDEEKIGITKNQEENSMTLGDLIKKKI